jgi:histidinol-phosphatase (PHP family)
MLPADGHVHSEWSWDARHGSMERTCARAVELGVPSVAFTEHADYTPWTIPAGPPGRVSPGTAEGQFTPPALDVDGYLACLQRCRERFPGLRILAGVELGEPHWHGRRVSDLLDLDCFDRVLGSVHTLAADSGRFLEIADAFRSQPAADVVRAYLTGILSLIKESATFGVLAHIDYVIRYWPAAAGPYDPAAFEDEHREVLRELAATSRALEINSQVPLHPLVLRWWHEAGGEAVTFGSDAHDPGELASRFADTAALAEAHGFRPASDPRDPWARS